NRESVLGGALESRGDIRIVSKLPPLAADRIGSAEIEECRITLQRSLTQLRRESIDGLLLHRPDDLSKPGADRLVAFLTDLKSSNKVARVGVSAYDRRQIDLALSRLPLDVVQLPVN